MKSRRLLLAIILILGVATAVIWDLRRFSASRHQDAQAEAARYAAKQAAQAEAAAAAELLSHNPTHEDWDRAVRQIWDQHWRDADLGVVFLNNGPLAGRYLIQRNRMQDYAATNFYSQFPGPFGMYYCDVQARGFLARDPGPDEPLSLRVTILLHKQGPFWHATEIPQDDRLQP